MESKPNLTRQPTTAELTQLRNFMWLQQLLASEGYQLFESLFADFAAIRADKGDSHAMDWIRPQLESLLQEQPQQPQNSDFGVFYEILKMLKNAKTGETDEFAVKKPPKSTPNYLLQIRNLQNRWNAHLFADDIESLNKLRQVGELRILITGTMSVGKSTLINALIGEKAAKTAAEALTAEIGYFESLAKPFKTWIQPQKAITIIDTPGVNAALNPEHGEITRTALHGKKAEIYDKVIYIFSADKLGTEDEMAHLQYVAENVPKHKLIFVLNKVDKFNMDTDSVEDSLAKLRADLQNLGYTYPQIYPISARFALLLKTAPQELSNKEVRDLAEYTEIFGEKEYNLSKFYPNSAQNAATDLMAARLEKLLFPHERSAVLARKCGIFGLEEILFGGLEERI
ncbi:MAG: 50S ribosome-binding GTPase [Defluviitaleaceae bacterium]|nr:50S ribosome-binding GTPase [Defluviitaleaceae bacterium]